MGRRRRRPVLLQDSTATIDPPIKKLSIIRAEHIKKAGELGELAHGIAFIIAALVFAAIHTIEQFPHILAGLNVFTKGAFDLFTNSTGTIIGTIVGSWMVNKIWK